MIKLDKPIYKEDWITKLNHLNYDEYLMYKEELLYLTWLTQYIEKKDKAIVNIGVFYGGSCAALLLGMNEFNITGTLYGIDTFKYHNYSNGGKPKMLPFRARKDVPWSNFFYETTLDTIRDFVGEKEVVFKEGFSDDMCLEEIGDISFIFIDGDHSIQGCLLDALKYSQKIVLGGFMVFHDFTGTKQIKQVKKAVELFLTVRPDFVERAICGSMIILRREAYEE